MDHLDVREILELAAVEPGGIERLMAGDTLESASVAGHLAGCEACATELERLHRSVPLLRDVVRTTPPADLRERTLAFVRERGEARTVAVGRESPGEGASPRTVTSPRRSPWRWIAAIAAAVVLSVAATGLFVGSQFDEQGRDVAALEAITEATIRVTTQDDARTVALAAAGGDASGTLLFSPGTTELVVVATGLEPPPADEEYRCWMSIDGERSDVGRMFFAGDIAFWIGDTPAVTTLPDGATFGVSVVDVHAPSLDADPVIRGDL